MTIHNDAPIISTSKSMKMIESCLVLEGAFDNKRSSAKIMHGEHSPVGKKGNSNTYHSIQIN